MQFNLDVIYLDEDQDKKVLCFTHAVQAAITGHMITPEVDEFGLSGNDMRNTSCTVCEKNRILSHLYLYQAETNQWWFENIDGTGNIGPFDTSHQGKLELEKYRARFTRRN